MPGAPLKPPASSRSLKSALNALGFVLGLLAVGFVVQRLRTYAAEIDLSRLTTGTLLALAGLACVSSLTNVFLALSWWRLLQFVQLDVPLRWAMRAHGVSQLARYVPGGIFQFAGRQAIGVAAGLAGGGLAKTVLWEILLLVTAGATLGLLAVPLVVSQVPSLLIVPLLALVFGLARRFLGPLRAQALVGYWILLGISGCVFVAVLALVQHTALPLPMVPSIAGAFVLGWLVGFVVPGAPAGGGIREAALLFLLGQFVVHGDLLLAIVVGRMVGVLGDALFFAIASFLPKSEPLHVA